jgi:hypothetical protein
MAGRRRAAAPVTDTTANGESSGPATENVVRDPESVPQPADREVGAELPVENVVVAAPTPTAPVAVEDEDTPDGDAP